MYFLNELSVMNIYKIFPKIIFVAMLLLIFSGCTSPKSRYLPEFNVNGSNENGKNYTSENKVNDVRGSCLAIDELSTCIDFVGPYWTNYLMDIECKKTGIFRQEACPKTDLGGCKINENYVAPIVSWYYKTGGKEFTEDDIIKMKERCPKLIEGSEWQELTL
jgi:hypothetical protein